jgi:hypothetical protein
MLKIDNTKREAFERCPRLYYWPYVKNYKRTTGNTALRYGSTWHAGMEGFYGHIAEHGWSRDGKAIEKAADAMKKKWDEETALYDEWYEDYRTLENCFSAFVKYVSVFAADEGMLKVIAPEQAFKIEMDIRGKNDIDPFYFTGQIDNVIDLNLVPWQMEHKTTGQAIHIQMQRLQRKAQMIGYFFAGRVIHKANPPQGSLIVLHHLSAYKSRSKDPNKAGKYGTPKIEFERCPQIFSDNDIKYWKESLLYTVSKIQKCTKEDFWPMQFDSCFTYGRCSFANLCEQCRPLGEEVLDGYFIGPEWDVSKDVVKIHKEND